MELDPAGSPPRDVLRELRVLRVKLRRSMREVQILDSLRSLGITEAVSPPRCPSAPLPRNPT